MQTVKYACWICHLLHMQLYIYISHIVLIENFPSEIYCIYDWYRSLWPSRKCCVIFGPKLFLAVEFQRAKAIFVDVNRRIGEKRSSNSQITVQLSGLQYTIQPKIVFIFPYGTLYDPRLCVWYEIHECM